MRDLVRTVVTVIALALSVYLLLTAGEPPVEPEVWQSVIGR